ncbi:hypothetical protein ABW19_dt0209680 [Dactylella cylindrospora]|nr:hypothetical protein ABW19_dt0209680 [Dactylella cylindrospora]
MADTPSSDGVLAATVTAPLKSLSTTKYKRPNYNIIHAEPLPVTVYHAPPLIPHNPLSLLHHLFLYFFPPTPSHEPAYVGRFSPITLSIEITDPKAVTDLWRRGFWGKGSLSRSEPTWLHREMRRLGDTHVGETSEEVTRRRRDQRREMKKERARKEREELQKIKETEAEKQHENGSTLGGKPAVDAKVVVDLEDEINGLNDLVDQPVHPSQSTTDTGLPTPPLSVSDEVETGDTTSSNVPDFGATPSAEAVATPPPLTACGTSSLATKVVRFDSATDTKDVAPEKTIVLDNEEHLQLTLSEAFFLVYALGILSINSSASSVPLSLPEVFRLFLRYSVFPPLSEASISLDNLNPDNPFLINYCVYHHFRSLGWVVKSGVKFSVDYLLYKRGPVFSHAEFAILILPNYSRWEGRKDASKEWHWLHSITRVNSQVKKTVVLVYVDVPTPREVVNWEQEQDGLKALFGKYRIREVALKRWISGRNRD